MVTQSVPVTVVLYDTRHQRASQVFVSVQMQPSQTGVPSVPPDLGRQGQVTRPDFPRSIIRRLEPFGSIVEAESENQAQ